jgi:hypothetical protein
MNNSRIPSLVQGSGQSVISSQFYPIALFLPVTEYAAGWVRELEVAELLGPDRDRTAKPT